MSRDLSSPSLAGGRSETRWRTWASTRPSVEMKGTLGSDQCAELISGARAVLLPSAWEETFGLVAVESMAAGVPPIATGHGSFTELITPGVDGVLFSPGDPDALALAIADVETNSEQYEVYGERARKTYAAPVRPAAQHCGTARDLPLRDHAPSLIAALS